MRPRSASRASPDGSIRPLSMQAFQWVSEEFRFAASIAIAHTLHCSRGAARCVRSIIPGALSILKGAVPDRARGLGHMAPTYFRREPGIERSDGLGGSALSSPITAVAVACVSLVFFFL